MTRHEDQREVEQRSGERRNEGQPDRRSDGSGDRRIGGGSDTCRDALSPEDVQRALDDAIVEQGQWLGRWHRALVCRLPQDSDVIAEDSHDCSEFGRWRLRHAGDALLSQAAFRDLWENFQAMHERARWIANEIGGSEAIPVATYDDMMAHADLFLSRARRLRDAFRKAVSELDTLTGISNRSVMLSELQGEFDRAVRTRSHCCIALADIDRFKQVNDTYGHAAGDRVLSVAAGRLLAHLRPYDSIYRYGGEEFLICLPNADPDAARQVLERLRASLEDAPIPLEDGRSLDVTCSFGVAEIDGGAGLKTVIERADRALYAAKEAGRNRVASWDEAIGG